MKQFVLIEDGYIEPLTKRETDLLEMMNELIREDYPSVVCVGFGKDDTFTGYINCEHKDVLLAAAIVNEAAMDLFIRNNLKRYREMEIDEDGTAIDPDTAFGE